MMVGSSEILIVLEYMSSFGAALGSGQDGTISKA